MLFVHRFTQSLALFPHGHALVPDGLLVPGADGTWTFARLPGPTDEELARLLACLVRRLTAVTREHLREPNPDEAADEPAATGDQALVQACVAEALRSPALLRRLAAILPAPRTRLVKYYGLFANRSRWRPALLRARAAAAAPPAGPAATDAPSEAPAPSASPPSPPPPAPPQPPPRRRRTPWAELLRRVLDVDAPTCPACTTPMVVLAFLTDPGTVARILTHLGLPTAPPPLAPARDPFDSAPLDLGPEEPPDDFPDPDRGNTPPTDSAGRAPPRLGARQPR